MKRILTAFAALVLSAGAALADPIEGTWQTEVDDGSYALVNVVPCGAGFCGVIARTFNSAGEYESPNKGRQIIREMVAQGGGRYEGQVWRPSNDKVYVGKVDLSGNSMALRGCVAGGLLCARQNWTRVR
ncbi:DUF2147 domain-containing protein [Jannaschia sp. W003]|uniref:DUF2147 domain-containing protein n=1 Tax=Jannaschia sp. W003 TaxID=2867012 RepID=UPI0021A430E1|nr:DUF2147 domain-containing protein [Jannaschia sp. W003]UWQ21119.1 DUF2147 domain-containing protein [Jannaschia sp. W003]